MADPLASLPWVFVAAVPGEGEECTLDAQEARHAIGARRLRIGDELALFDGSGTVARARLEAGQARKGPTQVRVVDRQILPQPQPRITLASALPKGDRLAVLVGMATQLGMTSFVPLTCERSVREPQRKFAERIRRLFIEACKQCKRPHLPTLHNEETPARIATWAASEGAAILVAHPTGRTMAQLWPANATSAAPRIVVMIGPEGGFTDEEVAAAAEAGARIVGLGEPVLRIETAAAAVLAWIMLASPAGRMDGP